MNLLSWELHVTEKRLLLNILKKSESELLAATNGFAAGVASCAPEVELLALARDVARLQLAVKQADAAVPWHLKVKYRQGPTMEWLASRLRHRRLRSECP